MDDLNKLEESILSIADGIPDTVVDTPSLQIDRLPGRSIPAMSFSTQRSSWRFSHVPVSAKSVDCREIVD
jgi:hypothetical protein